MLEIALVYVLSKKVAAIARDKGHSGVPYVILFIILWFGGEFAGALISMILSQKTDPDGTTYLMALAGAGVGTCIGFIVVSLIPAVDRPDDRERWHHDMRDENDRHDDDYRRRDQRRLEDGFREGPPRGDGRDHDDAIREGKPRRDSHDL